MKKRFHCGLIVGKFSPLHRGHEYLIRRALNACAEVVVLSYSKPEFPGCAADQREQWLAELFPETIRLVLDHERLIKQLPASSEWRELPHNEDDAVKHRRFCAYLVAEIVGREVDVIFTSEDYGDGFAEEVSRYYQKKNSAYPDVHHVSVDLARQTIPISGTLLRGQFSSLQQWVSPCVFASLVPRVCFLGGESTGKSTLTLALARRFQTEGVEEYGRQLWEEKNGELAYDDLLLIAQRQIALEQAAAVRAQAFLFCDTSPLTTLFYCRELFGRAPLELEALATRPYRHVIVCAPDFSFVQDGTRRDDRFRLKQHAWYLKELTERGIPYLLATGSIESRIQQVEVYLRTHPI